MTKNSPPTIHQDASFVLGEMFQRLKGWAAKAKPKDQEKISSRAAELDVLFKLLEHAQANRIVIMETNDDAYRRGYEAAKRKCGPARHGIIDRRRVVFDNFGSPYNPENEARRRQHNGRQARKWADHY